MQNPNYPVTEEMQKEELLRRVTPILNINIVVYRDGEYLLGKSHPDTRAAKNLAQDGDNPSLVEEWVDYYIFPGGRMRWNETLAECATRKLREELSGVSARFHKIVGVTTDYGYDPRAHGVSIYYLFNYESGEPVPNEHFSEFKWFTRDEFLSAEEIFQVDKTLASDIDLAVRSMNSSTDEVLVEVNQDDHDIGMITKRDAHSDPTRFHRAAHVFVFTSSGQVVLQRRSLNKSTSPGMWDMPGGHQAMGQTIDQCAYAELSEELGIRCELTLHSKELWSLALQSEWAYLYYGTSDGPYGFDRNEVIEVQVFDCEKVIRGEYTEYGILPHVAMYLEKLRKVWEPLTLVRTGEIQ